MEKNLKIPQSEQEVLDNIKIELLKVNIDIDEEELKKRMELQFRIKEYSEIPEIELIGYKLDIIFQIAGYQRNSFIVYDGHIISLHISPTKSNNLFVLPENIGNLTELQCLEIISLNLENLPKSLCKLKNLNTLNLRSNKLRKLPEEFGNLSKLRYLILSNNNLSFLPETFGNLSNLINLSLENNRLSSLPESFKNLHLRGLNLHKNPMISLSNISNLTWLDSYSFTATNFTPNGRHLSEPFDINCNVLYNEHIYLKTGVCRDLRPLAEYYSKSTTELAIQYCKKPDSLTPSEFGRLKWEARRNEREFLEKHFGPEDPILKEINRHMNYRLSSGYKIIK